VPSGPFPKQPLEHLFELRARYRSPLTLLARLARPACRPYGEAMVNTRVRRAWWLVLAPPLLTALLTVAAQYRASEGFSAGGDGFGLAALGFVLWGVSPSLALVGLAVATLVERWPGRVALVVGGVLLLVATAAMLWASLSSESSTSALGFLFAPLYGWVVVVLTAVALAIVGLVRRRTSR
jgi:hypothetical protein